MHRLRFAVLLILILLGVAAGLAKIMKMPQELEFFRAVGLAELSLVLFGAAQVCGAVLLVFRRSRLGGAVISMIMFSASAIMVFITGALGFGAVSLLPALLSAWIIWNTARSKSVTSELSR
ncbi:MAG: hypothetical protein OEM64_01020 [Gammaproteobacteria bacterium]|nr:hypothetical protein [Gammaproteobacteria bacterium]MDH3414868.1 hypothetical protein [Gammaproteobacteria bacterium]